MSTPVLAPEVSFILQIKVTFGPRDRDTFLKYFKPAYQAVIAEPECAYFFIGENFQEPGVYRWTEWWTKDATWFMTEKITKAYYKPYLKATEPLFTSPRVAEMYSPLEGMGHITMNARDRTRPRTIYQIEPAFHLSQTPFHAYAMPRKPKSI